MNIKCWFQGCTAFHSHLNVNSSNVCNVFTILVGYFSERHNGIVVENLRSLDVPSCTSENLFSTLKDMFKSVLSDSASTMRDTVNGVEMKIRNEVTPNLLDVDGEFCHHMPNNSLLSSTIY